MAAWKKLVEEPVDGEEYFVSRKSTPDMYIGRGKNGKTIWTLKPGIALHVPYDETLRKLMAEHEDWILYHIPEDWATRWRRRK